MDMGQWLSRLSYAIQNSQEMLLLWLLLARTMPIVLLTPYLGGRLIPNELKIGLGVGLVMLGFGFAAESVTDGLPTNAFAFSLLMGKEALLGFIIGFINAHLFWAMDMAGRMIDTARGTSMSEVQDPLSKQRVTPVGDLYIQLFVIIFMSLGGHRLFLRAYFESFALMPVDSFLHWDQTGSWMLLAGHLMRATADLWGIALLLAAPIMVATFLSDLVFGVLNRVAPQLNAYFLSMPVKAYGGLAMIFVSVGAIVIRFEDWTTQSIIWLRETLVFLSGQFL